MDIKTVTGWSAGGALILLLLGFLAVMSSSVGVALQAIGVAMLVAGLVAAVMKQVVAVMCIKKNGDVAIASMSELVKALTSAPLWLGLVFTGLILVVVGASKTSWLDIAGTLGQ